MLLILAQDDKAAEIAMEVFSEVSDATGTEQDYVILRNSGHLFPSDDARAMIDSLLTGSGDSVCVWIRVDVEQSGCR